MGRICSADCRHSPALLAEQICVTLPQKLVVIANGWMLPRALLCLVSEKEWAEGHLCDSHCPPFPVGLCGNWLRCLPQTCLGHVGPSVQKGNHQGRGRAGWWEREGPAGWGGESSLDPAPFPPLVFQGKRWPFSVFEPKHLRGRWVKS